MSTSARPAWETFGDEPDLAMRCAPSGDARTAELFGADDPYVKRQHLRSLPGLVPRLAGKSRQLLFARTSQAAKNEKARKKSSRPDEPQSLQFDHFDAISEPSEASVVTSARFAEHDATRRAHAGDDDENEDNCEESNYFGQLAREPFFDLVSELERGRLALGQSPKAQDIVEAHLANPDEAVDDGAVPRAKNPRFAHVGSPGLGLHEKGDRDGFKASNAARKKYHALKTQQSGNIVMIDDLQEAPVVDSPLATFAGAMWDETASSHGSPQGITSGVAFGSTETFPSGLTHDDEVGPDQFDLFASLTRAPRTDAERAAREAKTDELVWWADSNNDDDDPALSPKINSPAARRLSNANRSGGGVTDPAAKMFDGYVPPPSLGVAARATAAAAEANEVRSLCVSFVA